MFTLSKSFYISGNLAWLNRRNHFTYLPYEPYDNLVTSSTNQLSVKLGLGYSISSEVSLEVSPYYQKNIGSTRFEGWKTIATENLFGEYSDDFGVAGSVKYQFDRFYIKSSYDVGLNKIGELMDTNEQGDYIGDSYVKNRMITLFVGYTL